jgi:hypothetical protein
MARGLVMNETSTSSTLRRRLWPRRNELMRPADWIEAACLLAVLIAALVLLPVTLAVGSETYANQARLGQEQSRTRHPTTATLATDAPPQSVGTRGELVRGVSLVPARWTLPDGTERAGTVLADDGARAGDPVAIWLDGAGNVTEAPISDGHAAGDGFAVALALWISAVAVLYVIFLLTRAVLNRSRSAAWQREWARVERDWSRSI